MAKIVMLACDRHLARGEKVDGEDRNIDIDGIKGKPTLCDECYNELIGPVLQLLKSTGGEEGEEESEEEEPEDEYEEEEEPEEPEDKYEEEGEEEPEDEYEEEEEPEEPPRPARRPSRRDRAVPPGHR